MAHILKEVDSRKCEYCKTHFTVIRTRLGEFWQCKNCGCTIKK